MKHFKNFKDYVNRDIKNNDTWSVPFIADGGPPNIYDRNSTVMKMSKKELAKLKELDYKYGKVFNKRELDYQRNILNADEEKKKFFNARKKGKCYNPIFKHNPPTYKKDGTLDEAIKLRKEFKNFDNYLSQFYIDRLNYLIGYMKIIETNKRSKEYADGIRNLFGRPSQHLVQKAERLIKENPFVIRDESDKTIGSEEMKSRIEKELKKLGYDKWKVHITDTITPRMNVKDEYKVNINSEAKFSEIDFESLVAHELKGHVGRRFYGDKIGLDLFRFGLEGKNNTDEGLAIYNSLQIKNPKPNVLWNICLFIIAANQVDRLNFCELFDFIDQYVDDDETCWKKTVRMKRNCEDTSMLFGDAEIDYLDGYLKVKDMSDAQRESLLKFQVGPQTLADIPKIKNFLEVNGFIDKDF